MYVNAWYFHSTDLHVTVIVQSFGEDTDSHASFKVYESVQMQPNGNKYRRIQITLEFYGWQN